MNSDISEVTSDMSAVREASLSCITIWMGDCLGIHSAVDIYETLILVNPMVLLGDIDNIAQSFLETKQVICTLKYCI